MLFVERSLRACLWISTLSRLIRFLPVHSYAGTHWTIPCKGSSDTARSGPGRHLSASLLFELLCSKLHVRIVLFPFNFCAFFPLALVNLLSPGLIFFIIMKHSSFISGNSLNFTLSHITITFLTVSSYEVYIYQCLCFWRVSILYYIALFGNRISLGFFIF